MQVMNSAEFEQTEILIGQQGKTEAFGVSEDAALMSMLSTGLYSNPLRTMLQEIMFNAWDAHRMSNIQDTTPIDIYLNDTTGLIIRDYGPGISKKDMIPVYCIYGNSTKREDKNSTGGFGLGSKSPFAYTESFTVASYHEKKQNLYLISRVSDDNDGRPGLTPIVVDVPTEEAGLRVTVPFKSEHDMATAYEYIKDLLKFSGIWCNLHYKDDPVEEIKSDRLPAGHWISDDHIPANHSHGIWAVYGGVRYLIPLKDEFEEEYKFLTKFRSSQYTSLYIGFAPDSLTPLPSREGLNFSEQTTEVVRAALETVCEYLRKTFKPSIRHILEVSLKELRETSQIPDEFLAYAWRRLGPRSSLSELTDRDWSMMKELINEAPNEISPEAWISLTHFVWRNTEDAMHMFGGEEFRKLKAISWMKVTRNSKFTAYVSESASNRTVQAKGHMELAGVPVNMEFHKTLIKLKQLTDQKLSYRVLPNHRETWIKVDGWRGKQKTCTRSHKESRIIQALAKDNKWKTPKIENFNYFFEPDGTMLSTIFVPRTIVIAQTASALNDTPIQISKVFAKGLLTHNQYYSAHSWQQYQDSSYVKPVMGLVVHKKKGQYDLAVKYLKELGWNVIEGTLPEVKAPSVKVVKAPAEAKTDYVTVPSVTDSFPLFTGRGHGWVDWDVPEVDKPDFYFCATLTAIRADSWHTTSRDRPSDSMKRWILENLPNTVLLHNKARINKVEKAGAKYIPTYLMNRVDKILTNQDYINKLAVHKYVRRYSPFNDRLMRIPEFQKLFGVPYIRTKDKKQFEFDLNFIEMMKDESWPEIDYSKRREITQALDPDALDKSLFAVAEKTIKKAKIFSSGYVNSHISGKTDGEVLMYSQKLSRLLRTI